MFDSSGKLLYRAEQFVEERFWVDIALREEGRSGTDAVVVATGDLLEG